MKESMLKRVRIGAGLGNPPEEYTNNDPEAANFMIKHALKFDPKRPHEFIAEMRNIVVTQFRNEGRAVFGKGPYKIRPEFQHLAVNDAQWGKLSTAERVTRIERYVKSGMESKKVVSNKRRKVSSVQASSLAPLLSMTASGAGISAVPSSILATMFDKANNLVRMPGHVVAKPGATDGSYVVAAYGNATYSVTPGKGGCLKCDRSCVNFSTDICEHVLAVAHIRGSLQEYLQWYKKSRRGPKVLEMALGSGPKNAGKKPSRRKKTNKTRATVTEVVDLMPHNSAAPQHPTEQPAVLRQPPEVVSSPSIPPFVPPFQMPHQHLAQANSQALQHCSFPTKVAPLSQENLFRLKWVAGTTVSRCYGCNGEIKNPPVSIPDDLVVVYRDIRQFREREIG